MVTDMNFLTMSITLLNNYASILVGNKYDIQYDGDMETSLCLNVLSVFAVILLIAKTQLMLKIRKRGDHLYFLETIR